MQFLIAACAAALLAIGWQSKVQWTKDDDPARESYTQDFANCNDSATQKAGDDFSAQESGDEKAGAIALRRAAYFRSCMEGLGYARGR